MPIVCDDPMALCRRISIPWTHNAGFGWPRYPPPVLELTACVHICCWRYEFVRTYPCRFAHLLSAHCIPGVCPLQL
ncbi:hypothetical protein VTN49DRAFT_1257 [Thermomyces lanuginosus]|uniref:uncharacterized protein n=1 Tax=Thermomyces lanuginosus TaxID=5541 RepID=UPI0037445BAC